MDLKMKTSVAKQLAKNFIERGHSIGMHKDWE